GSSASSSVNAPLVSPCVAFTVIRKPPRSIGRPSPGRNTIASGTLAPDGDLPRRARHLRIARGFAAVPRAARLLGAADRLDDESGSHVGIGMGVRTTVLDVPSPVRRHLPR